MTTPTAGSRVPTQRRLQCAAALLAAVFALPSCLTRALWTRWPRTVEEADTHLLLAMPPSPPGIAIAPSPITAHIAADMQPPPASADWLIATPTGDQAAAAATALALELPPDARQMVYVIVEADAPGAPPGVELQIYDGERWIRTPCDLAFAAAPPVGTRPRRALVVRRVKADVAVLPALAMSPFALAIDIALSPIELATLPAWW